LENRWVSDGFKLHDLHAPAQMTRLSGACLKAPTTYRKQCGEKKTDDFQAKVIIAL
jgi:hypothetical protein